MSEEWPDGWYRDEPSQQATQSFTPRRDTEGSSYEPTRAASVTGTSWRAGRTAGHAPRPVWV
jgi:hypothetical protein